MSRQFGSRILVGTALGALLLGGVAGVAITAATDDEHEPRWAEPRVDRFDHRGDGRGFGERRREWTMPEGRSREDGLPDVDGEQDWRMPEGRTHDEAPPDVDVPLPGDLRPQR